MKPLFINKYRPIMFDDYDDNITVVPTIKLLIHTNCTNILILGDNNSGKSTILNSIFKEYYRDISPATYSNNILFINNISEQGINYYRNEVKHFCQIRSNIHDKKKLIVLDDIDLVNEQSQQVFRGFIDNFSKNVLFVASTGNMKKVIDSLQSRFTILKLDPFNERTVSNIINTIKRNELISIDKEAENFIVRISNSNIKVLLQYLQKCKLINTHITMELVHNICCNISLIVFEQYTIFVKEKNLISAINILNKLHDNGYSIIDILEGYFSFVKKTKLFDDELKYKIIKFICKYIYIFYNIHEDEIELSFFTNNLINIV